MAWIIIIMLLLLALCLVLLSPVALHVDTRIPAATVQWLHIGKVITVDVHFAGDCMFSLFYSGRNSRGNYYAAGYDFCSCYFAVPGNEKQQCTKSIGTIYRAESNSAP